MLHEVKGVAFDAFGTLVEIADKRRPYARLLALAPKGVRERLKDRVMRQPLSLDDCLYETGDAIGTEDADRLRKDLAAELASIRLRPRTAALWSRVREEGLFIAVCSNLALPYGQPLLDLLPDRPDAIVLSYEAGAVKPEPAIYARVAEALGLPSGAILFSGDTREADVEGPRAAGMRAMPIGDLEASLSHREEDRHCAAKARERPAGRCSGSRPTRAP